MSTPAPAERKTRDVARLASKNWDLTVTSESSPPVVLVETEMIFDTISTGAPGTTIFRGHMNDAEQTTFEGTIDPKGGIQFSLQYDGKTCSFDGKISASGESMSGIVTYFSSSVGSGDGEVEDSWSAQARGVPPDEEDAEDKGGRPPHKPAAGKDRKLGPRRRSARGNFTPREGK